MSTKDLYFLLVCAQNSKIPEWAHFRYYDWATMKTRLRGIHNEYSQWYSWNLVFNYFVYGRSIRISKVSCKLKKCVPFVYVLHFTCKTELVILIHNFPSVKEVKPREQATGMLTENTLQRCHILSNTSIK